MANNRGDQKFEKSDPPVNIARLETDIRVHAILLEIAGLCPTKLRDICFEY
ncbi:hypothetical protein PanWU01x14_231790, partial [Parasponia andersonii]